MRPSTLLASLSILGVVGVGLAYPAFAQDPRKDATDATKAANAGCSTSCRSPTAPISRTRSGGSSRRCRPR